MPLRGLKKRPPVKKGVFQLPRATLSNDALVAGLLSGNGNAALQFHERYNDRISRWVWRLLGADLDHEDVVQQVFVNILGNLDTLEKTGSLDSWVDSVVIRTVRYELRRRKKRRTWFKGTSEMEIDEYCDPKSPFRQVHVRRFYAVLDSMPDDDRIVFVFKHLEGYCYQQIAIFLDCSLTTVKRRIRRANALFKNRILKDSVLISLLEESNAT